MSWSMDIGAIFAYAAEVVDNILPFVYTAAGISIGFTVLFKIAEALK